MKQKKTQVCFYSFLLIILSFSLQASVIDLPAFYIGLGQSGEISATGLSDYPGTTHSLASRCPRNDGDEDSGDEDDYDEDWHEQNCMAAYRECVNGCRNRIDERLSNETKSIRKESCYADCTKTYMSCLE